MSITQKTKILRNNLKKRGKKKQATKVAGSATYKQYETVAF